MNKVVDLSVVSESALHYSPIDMLRDAIADIENNCEAYQGKKAFLVIVDDPGSDFRLRGKWPACASMKPLACWKSPRQD